MAVTIIERHKSRKHTASWTNPSIEFLLAAWGSMDEEEVYAAVVAYLPLTYSNLTLLIDSIEGDPQGGGVWYYTAKYGVARAGTQADGTPLEGVGGSGGPTTPPPLPATDEALGPEFSGDFSGGTIKLMKGYEIVSSEVAPSIAGGGGGPPNYGGAIGVGKDSVEGTEVESGNFSWQVTKKFAFVTRNYWLKIRRMAYTVNDDEWWGSGKRTVRFDGASIRISSNLEAEITFKFTEQESEYDILLGPDADQFTIAEKLGWDYLDVGFGPGESEGFKVEVPKYAFVHRVYRESDFTELEIG